MCFCFVLFHFCVAVFLTVFCPNMVDLVVNTSYYMEGGSAGGGDLHAALAE